MKVKDVKALLDLVDDDQDIRMISAVGYDSSDSSAAALFFEVYSGKRELILGGVEPGQVEEMQRDINHYQVLGSTAEWRDTKGE